MAYCYSAERDKILTDEGQRMLLRVRDRVQQLLRDAGAFTMGRAMEAAGSGDTWTMMACVDRMVELGEIKRITPIGSCSGQDEVFTSAKGSR